jgi:hypothetical protein
MANEILKYSYGNQISRSTLSIYDNGDVVRTEKAGGGGRQVNVPMKDLTPAQLATLKRRIETAADAESATGDRKLTGLGQRFGSLEVESADGEEVVIRDFVWRDDEFTYNDSSAGDALVRFTNGLVSVDMDTTRPA